MTLISLVGLVWVAGRLQWTIKGTAYNIQLHRRTKSLERLKSYGGEEKENKRKVVTGILWPVEHRGTTVGLS